jgi:exopolyphosphatase/guanosine-5'-triphosphate,3'-diphosphate pyrophosphatase
MKIGILDIGTNSIHILIAEIGRDMSFEIVGRAKDMTRLGDGTLKTGFISREKIERAVGVIKQFAQLARNRGVPRVFGVATAAVREASNGGEFLDRVQRECGIKVRTVTGDEEGRLIYLAVRHFMQLGGRTAFIIDIGGGSAELIAGNEKELTFNRSHKLGGARLKDLFITKCPVPKSDHQRIHRHIVESLAPSLEELRALPIEEVIGTSGTIINLGSVIKEHRDDEPLTNPQGFTFTPKNWRTSTRIFSARTKRNWTTSRVWTPSAKTSSSPAPASCWSSFTGWARSASLCATAPSAKA